MDWVVKWLRSRNITSHTVAGVITLIAFTYISDTEVRSYVTELLQNHPKIIAFITWVFVMWLKYSNAHSPIGTLEEVPKAEAKLSMQIESIKQDEKERQGQENKEK